MEGLRFDGLLEIVFHLDAISIVRFLGTSTKLWKLRQNEIIQSRIVPYKQFIKYEMWSKGLLLSVSKQNIPQIQYFLDEGADDVNNALFEASVTGNKYLIEFFISQGASRWNRGLEGAALGGNLELVQFFLDKGAKSWFQKGMLEAIRGKNRVIINLFIEMGFRNWNAAATIACEVGDKSIAELCFSKQSRPLLVGEPLRAAVANGHQEIVEMLLMEPLVNLEHALAGAAARGDRKMVEFFLEKGAAVSSQALSNASRMGHIELVKLFVDKGRGLVGQGFNEALREAAKNNHKEVVEVLIPHCFDRTYGLAGAFEGGHKDLIDFFIQKAGVLPYASCFYAAVRSGRKDIVKYIMVLEHVDLTEGVRVACEHGHKAIVEMFLGMDDSALDYRSGNALISAVDGGYHKVVKLLVERGLFEQKKELDTAMKRATALGDWTLVKYFQDLGAS